MRYKSQRFGNQMVRTEMVKLEALILNDKSTLHTHSEG